MANVSCSSGLPWWLRWLRICLQFRRPGFNPGSGDPLEKGREGLPTPIFLGFPGGSDSKESTCNAGDPSFNSWVSKIPWRRDGLPTPAFLGFPGGSDSKESACSAGDPSLIPRLERSPGEGMGYPLQYSWASLVTQLVKNPPAMWETWVQFLGWEDPLEKGKASILAWRIPWTV